MNVFLMHLLPQHTKPSLGCTFRSLSDWRQELVEQRAEREDDAPAAQGSAAQSHEAVKIQVRPVSACQLHALLDQSS